MDPSSEDLDGDGLRILGLDDLEVAIAYLVRSAAERRPEKIDVAHHPLVVELVTGDGDVDPVVMRVQLALGPFHAGHHVPGGDDFVYPDFVHASLITQGCVQQTRLRLVDAFIGDVRLAERKLVGGEDGEGKVGHELTRDSSAALARPHAGQPGRNRGHLHAPDGQPPPMKLGAEGQGDRLRPVPRHDERGALVREHAQSVGQGRRIPARFDHERYARAVTDSAHVLAEVCRRHGLDPERCGNVATPSQRFAAHDSCAGALQEQSGQKSDDAQPCDDYEHARRRPGLEADLEGRLYQRKQRRDAGFRPFDLESVAGVDHEPVLMRMKGEDQRPVSEAVATLDPPDCAVAVPEGVGEVSRQGGKRVVEGQARVDLAPVGEQLRARADAREQGSHQDLPGARGRELSRSDLDGSRPDEPDCVRVSHMCRRACLGVTSFWLRHYGSRDRAAHTVRDGGRMVAPTELTRVTLPTPYGEFDAHAFESPGGIVQLALVRGNVAGRSGVLTRVHSECLTGDALGSLRCDCGIQLRLALRMIAASGEGVLVYVTGHEGRGIGLMNKFRAYVEQDNGADTVDANLHLGLPVDARTYDGVAQVLTALAIDSVILLTNNPAKVEALTQLGVKIETMRPLSIAPHTRSRGYLRTKRARLRHVEPADGTLTALDATPPDVAALMGPVRPWPDRPYVVLKYAQTLDGRIATASGDSKWISCEAERTVSHALRAACDAVMVGIDTVVRDDPQLTVRMVPGSSPLRVILDSTLRMPREAKVLGDHAGTIVFTTDQSSPLLRQWLAERHVAVNVVDSGPGGVDVVQVLRVLRDGGIASLLIEGGAKVITSLLSARVVDRVVVALAPTIVGDGTQAVGDLGVDRIVDGIRLENRFACSIDADVLVGFDVAPTTERDPSATRAQ